MKCSVYLKKSSLKMLLVWHETFPMEGQKHLIRIFCEMAEDICKKGGRKYFLSYFSEWHIAVTANIKMN